MQKLKCKHCGGSVEEGDKSCGHCGIPLPPSFAKAPQRKFVWWFIALTIFCIVMIIWLPPDWTHFGK